MDAKHVNFDDNWRPYTDGDRKTPELAGSGSPLADDMENWNASDDWMPALTITNAKFLSIGC